MGVPPMSKKKFVNWLPTVYADEIAGKIGSVPAKLMNTTRDPLAKSGG